MNGIDYEICTVNKTFYVYQYTHEYIPPIQKPKEDAFKWKLINHLRE